MPYAIVLPLFVGQLLSWFAFINFLLSPNEWDDADLTKKNFILLLVPLGYLYFVWLGVKKFFTFVAKTYMGLK